jgi:hypothetical protein
VALAACFKAATKVSVPRVGVSRKERLQNESQEGLGHRYWEDVIVSETAG